MVMHEGLNGFYHRQRVCCRCGKIFRIPPTGRYPYLLVRHGHNQNYLLYKVVKNLNSNHRTIYDNMIGKWEKDNDCTTD